MASIASTTRTDEEIQRDVLAELKWDARIQPNEIGVAVKNGIVSLMGSVDSYAKRWAAEEAAHRVKGVTAVVNDLEVRLLSTGARSDEDIAKAIVNALQWDAFVSIDKLDVTVSEGWVTMRGQVEWEYQRRDAERAAWLAPGVTAVDNRISISL